MRQLDEMTECTLEHCFINCKDTVDVFVLTLFGRFNEHTECKPSQFGSREGTMA